MMFYSELIIQSCEFLRNIESFDRVYRTFFYGKKEKTSIESCYVSRFMDLCEINFDFL